MENEIATDRTTEELEIANAFAEFANETPPAAVAPVEPAPTAEPAPVAVAPVEPAPTAEPAPVAVAPTPAPAVEDPRIADLQAQIEALKPKEQPAPAAPLYTADEETALKKYAEDWPDIQKAEALARRAEYRELVGYVFDQFNREIKKVKEEYAPALSYVHTRSGHDQYADIKALVPDYDTVRDKTLAWIETQPSWLKSAYSKVASEGTPNEVAGLIGLYKKETGQVAPAAIAAPVAAPTVIETLSPAAKAAAAKLTLVKTGRSEAGTATEDTFENAFAAYAAEEDRRLSKK